MDDKREMIVKVCHHNQGTLYGNMSDNIFCEVEAIYRNAWQVSK